MTEFLYWVSPVMGLLREAPEHDRAPSERHTGLTGPSGSRSSVALFAPLAIFPRNESGRRWT